ncbi:hypothetical protein Tco_1276724, partial [Tanacetum coccineum]
EFEEDLITYCIENGIFQDSQETFESSDDNTNVINVLQEPIIVNQDPGVKSSQGAHYGYNCPPKVPIISNPEQCNQTINELSQILSSFHLTCNYEDENSFTYDSKPNSFNDSPSILTHPLQLQFETYLCGNNAHYGYDCPPQFPFVYEQEPRKKEEERRIVEEQAAKDRYWKIPICYDDDEDYTIAITPISSTNDLVNSLIMGDEHLDTIPATESDEVIKSSVENLVLIPSESEGIPNSVCDVPLCNNPIPLEAFKEHSETIIDSNNDYSSSEMILMRTSIMSMHHLPMLRSSA